MTNAIQYLEAAKVEEVAAQLEAEGYKVIKEEPDKGYDLVATKAGKTIAVEVKARTKLRDEADQIQMLRHLAKERGYDEFRLVVVSPPHEMSVEIEKLGQVLMEYLVNNFPAELNRIAPQIYIGQISDINIHSLNISTEGIRVNGSGILDTLLEYGNGRVEDTSWSYDFPFDFDIKLNHNLQVEEIYQLKIDTSEFQD